MSLLTGGVMPNGIDTDTSIVDSETKADFIYNILKEMKGYLNQRQMTELNQVLIRKCKDVDIIGKEKLFGEDTELDNNRLVDEYLVCKEMEGCTPKTVRAYERIVRKAINEIGKPVNRIKTNDIRKWLQSKSNTNSQISIDNNRRLLNGFFTWLRVEEYIIHSPMDKIKKIKGPRVLKKPFTREDIELLRETSKDIRDRAMIEFLLSTGVRVGELCSIDKKDVDFNNKKCTVFGKGQKERIVYFNDITLHYLKKYMAHRKDNNPALFMSLKNDTRLGISGAERRVRALGNRAGVKNCHPHRFRRTMATNAINNGMPIEQVQVLLGHSNIDTTTIYAIVNEDNVQANYNKYLN